MWMKKQHSPPSERNKEPIWNVLQTHVLPKLEETTPSTLRVLEVAGGSGVHTAHMVQQLYQRYHKNKAETNQGKLPSSFLWIPSDPDASARDSQLAYIQDELTQEQQTHVTTPPLCLTLDAAGIREAEARQQLPMALDLMINVNMIHISPWTATQGLLKLAQERLRPGGILYLYGPYKVKGTAVPSNLKFDQFLQKRDPSFGVRNLEDVVALAQQHGLEQVRVVEMPANNLSVVLQKKTTTMEE